MIEDVVIERRRPRQVVSWVTGKHLPSPYRAVDGTWHCHDCGARLRPYPTRTGEHRLRHYSDGRR